MPNYLRLITFFSILFLSITATAFAQKGEQTMNPSHKKATFAGGCFWCMEPPFENAKGVIDVISGYAGGDINNPSYDEVSQGGTGHLETIQITYDPKIISYSELLSIYWKQIDPTDAGGSFVDRGTQYSSAIFYHDEEQKKLAELSKETMDKSGIYKKPIVTAIRKFEDFYKAEEYHQDYSSRNPVRYKFYRYQSGRDAFLEKVWKNNKRPMCKPVKSNSNTKSELTDLQYKVTQENGTEKPFENEYWDNEIEGIYVDIISGEPLFSSVDKYKSGSGWPSFTKPIEKDAVVEKEDKSLFLATRTEVRGKKSDSHLGHVFDDGPKPTGLRYCMNSASLKFIPKEELKEKGLEKYLSLFE